MRKVLFFKSIYLTIMILFSLIFSGCDLNNGAPADPPGTITHNLIFANDPFSLIFYEGEADESYIHYFYNNCDSLTHIRVWLGINSSTNFFFKSEYYGCSIYLQDLGCKISDIGPVQGLGDINDIPAYGWVNTAAVEVGHGYVFRFKKTWDIDNPLKPYYYGRVYVVDYITSATTGGVIGYVLKYKFPF